MSDEVAKQKNYVLEGTCCQIVSNGTTQFTYGMHLADIRLAPSPSRRRMRPCRI